MTSVTTFLCASNGSVVPRWLCHAGVSKVAQSMRSSLDAVAVNSGDMIYNYHLFAAVQAMLAPLLPHAFR
jgi:hypothetical protein